MIGGEHRNTSIFRCHFPERKKKVKIKNKQTKSKIMLKKYERKIKDEAQFSFWFHIF